jgi:hypothetical protein
VTPADMCGPCMDDLVLFMGGRSLEDERPATGRREREKADG